MGDSGNDWSAHCETHGRNYPPDQDGCSECFIDKHQSEQPQEHDGSNLYCLDRAEARWLFSAFGCSMDCDGFADVMERISEVTETPLPEGHDA